MLGEMLIELKQPGRALSELEAVMRKEPNRFRALYFGARAASLNGDDAKARDYAAQLLQMCGNADAAGRPELAEARRLAKMQ